MPVFRPALLALALAFATTSPACFAQDAVAGTRAENPYLSQADAEARSRRVSNVEYVLDYTLTGAPTFTSTSRIDFDLADADAPLTVDLDKATIKSLVVNGKALAPAYNQWFITLPASALKKGRNRVIVDFTREHSTNGEGLHRYEDKADGRVYLYSHFEPAAAHQMFASFDQPDLKAVYRLTVTAPKDWQVISTTRESRITDAGDGSRVWAFPATPKLSAYNFSLHAGPYKVWEDASGKYPMRLFARQAVSAQVKPEEWFKYTKQGLVYFDEYFGIPYPFKKYDQVLVPQFIYGAMENAAAVTFTETRFLSEGPSTLVYRQRLAGTILHEMAHQWFGDLVTMRWWNGLWLNESFASYMATLGGASSGEFEHPWLSQYRSKQGAYRLDESIATHPIEVPVPSTQNAFDNIDAITYTKGASTLHQLRQLIGPEVFRRGVHDYLVKHSYGNATLDDFIGALSEASGRDLGPWAKEWLYAPGLNTLGAEFACEDGKISRFALVQAAANAANPTLRSQLVQVALFDAGADALTLAHKEAVTYTGARTEVPTLVGRACPALVYPNYEDWGFVKVVLDPVSFGTARTHLSKVDDVMLRSMLWQSLSDGFSDRRLSLQDYLAAVLDNAPLERDDALLRQAQTSMTVGRGYLRTFGDDTAYGRATVARMEAVAWAGLKASAGEHDRAKAWLDTYVDLASSPAALARLEGLLDGKPEALDGIDAGLVDQELRWDIVQRLSRFGAKGAAARIAAESARDPSERGQLSALAATVAAPDAAVKAEWLAKIQALPTKDLPFSRLRTAMTNLYPGGQSALAEQTAAQRLATLAELDAKADPVFMRTYAGTMIPGSCTAEGVARLEAAIASAPATLSAGTKRALLSARESQERCVAIRAAYDAAAASGGK
jgi:aminopeptidase N